MGDGDGGWWGRMVGGAWGGPQDHLLRACSRMFSEALQKLSGSRPGRLKRRETQAVAAAEYMLLFQNRCE